MNERDRMDRRHLWIPWALVSVTFVAVAVAAYSFGVARAGAGFAGGGPAGRVWFGFPGFWFFIFLWIGLGFFRRAYWWGWYPHRPWRYGRYYPPHDDEYEEWDAWHRHAHDRMNRTNGVASGEPDRPHSS